MFHSKKSAFRTGIAVTALCVVLTLTAGCSVNSKKGNTAADVQNELQTVGKEQTTMAMAATEPAEPMKEPETAETHLTESSAAVTKETTEKETAAEETVSESPLEIKEIPGISAVSGYVISGEPFDEQWSERSLEIAAWFYKDFIHCAVEIDGIWKRGLYNEEHNLLIVQNDRTIEHYTQDYLGNPDYYTSREKVYTIYHGDETIDIGSSVPFPCEDFVRIELVDVNGDEEEELFIHTAYGPVRPLAAMIHIDPLVLMTELYDYSKPLEMNTFIPQCRIVSAEAVGEEIAKVEVEFILESGEKVLFDMEIEGADLSCLDQYEIHFYSVEGFGISVIEAEDYEENGEMEVVAYRFHYEVQQRGLRKGMAWINMRIGLEYDEDAKHYRQNDEVTIESGVYHYYPQ